MKLYKSIKKTSFLKKNNFGNKIFDFLKNNKKNIKSLNKKYFFLKKIK